MLSPESLKKIDQEIAKYPADQKQSASMSALRIAQQEKGWLANETIEFVAKYLGMPPVAVYEVASFYNMYDLAPGARKITVCTNLPCALSGECMRRSTSRRSLALISMRRLPTESSR
jgi:NADH-quinone oxidoreductase subunit E